MELTIETLELSSELMLSGEMEREVWKRLSSTELEGARYGIKPNLVFLVFIALYILGTWHLLALI